MEPDTRTWGARHPMLRNLVYGAGALIALGVLGWMFGWDNVLDLGRDLLAQAGWIAGAP